MKKTIMILASITGISFLLATPTMQSKAATTTTQSERSPRIDETNNVTITDFDDTVKNSTGAYHSAISTNDTHSLGIQISSKSELEDFDINQITLEASWGGSSPSSVVPLPNWIKVSGIQNVTYSADHKTVTFDLIFSIDQERLIAALGSLDNIKMLVIRIKTNFGGSIANNAGTITFENITAGSQPSDSTETTDTTTVTGSTEPSDSTTPSGSSTTPSESTGPSSSNEPSESTESSSSTTPSESTGPSSSSEPSEPTGPSSSNEPSESTESSSTTTPSGSTESSESSTLPKMDESSSTLKTTETSDSSPSNSETTKKNPLSHRVSEDSSDSSHINTHVASSTTKYGSYPKTGAVQHPLVAAFGFLLIGLALVIKKK